MEFLGFEYLKINFVSGPAFKFDKETYDNSSI